VPTGACVALVGSALALLNSAIDEIGNPRLRTEQAFESELRAAGISPTLSTPVLRCEVD
jgi:peptide/nickel transport system permease protein